MTETLYQAIVRLGIDHDHHESDLYLPKTSQVDELLLKYPDANPSRFTCCITRELWYDIPFAYDPAWERKKK